MNIFQPRRRILRIVDLDLKQDYISNLPTNVKEEVLMKLPIKEAVKTSLLSTKWKYAWMSIPNLVFIENCAQSELIRLVDQVLLVHRGPILQFKLVSRHACNEAIGRWMLILSRNGIKNLYIKLGSLFEECMIPSSLLSCLALEHVHISCSAIYFPQSFLGFKFLRTLRLLEFNLTGIAVAKLISSCALLESLELSGFDNFGHFVIRAPNLRWLSIAGGFVDLCFETPKLLFAKIYYSGEFEDESLASKDCKSNILRVLGSLSAIEELQLCSDFITYLAEGPIPEVLPVPFYQLTKLHIDFYYIFEEEVAAAFCLFKSAPNLKVLSLKLDKVENYPSSSLAHSFWEVKGIEYNLFNCLQIVKINMYRYSESILEVAKFVLSTAPVLEKLVIREQRCWVNSIMDDRVFLKKLASFRRLSKMAEIVFV